MNVRFERRLFKAKNPRLRKRNVRHPKKFLPARSHVEGFLDELAEDLSADDMPGKPSLLQTARDFDEAVGMMAVAPALISEGLAVAMAQDGADALRKRLDRKRRRALLERRRTYYAAEAAIRHAQKAEIEAARPEPAHPCPTPEELTEAYSRRRENEEWKVRFGTLMIDLEEHVRRTYVHAGNRFSGSAGGVKEWLERHCPLLARHYSTCQRYKRKLQDEPDSDSGT